MEKKLPYWLGLLLCLISLTAQAQQVTEEWTRRYDGKGSQDNLGAYIAVDSAGNSYITGITNSSEYDSDYKSKIITVKYSPSGDKLWEKAFGEDQTSRARAITVDNQGSVYVTGSGTKTSSNDYGEFDYVTVRYDAATGEEKWVQYYNGNSNGADEPSAIAVDNSGSVYVTGASSSSGPNDNTSDYATIRYDATTGQEMWVKHHNGSSDNHDVANDIVIDLHGNVFVTGYSLSYTPEGNQTSKYVTIRYDAITGQESWVKHYVSPLSKRNVATDIAVDAEGGVYVTGTSYINDNVSAYATIRYEVTTGSEEWAQLYLGDSSSINSVNDIAVDNQGSVYVTGVSTNENYDADIITVSYEASTGHEKWSERYESESNSYSSAIAVNNQTVIITGSVNRDYFTMGYNSATGKINWTQVYNGPDNGYDGGEDIAVDSKGGVYVTGTSPGKDSGPDFATIRYNATTGIQSWTSRYDVIGSLADNSLAVVVDVEGNSYVTGSSSYTSELQNRASIITIKYSPTGDTLWVQDYKVGPDNRAVAIVLDNQGGVYVTGYSYRGETKNDYVTIRYDQHTGQQSWVSNYNGSANGYDISRAIVADNKGGIYVTGYSYSHSSSNETEITDYATIRYEATTGAQTWVSRYNEGTATAISIDNEDGVYVTGSSATIRYEASTGKETWVQPTIKEGTKISYYEAIVVDNRGGVYVTGYVYDWLTNIEDYLTIRYESDTGESTWSQQYGGSTGGIDNATAITADNKGGVYVTGSSSSENYTQDYATIRYEASTGQETWVQRYNRAGQSESSDRAKALAVDDVGSVYVTGTSRGVYSTSVFSTVKYNTANGAQIWDVQTEGPLDAAVDMALDREGNIFVTGYTNRISSTYDFLTVKYSQNQCPSLADVAIQGSSTAMVGSKGSTYSLSDPGATSFTWDITDGGGANYASFTGQGKDVIAINWPITPNVYKIKVTYGSEAGCTTRDTTLYVYVFDPAAGFVTGGGWITSPVNSAYEFMQQSTKAYFGLMTKYKKGEENQLQGETQLLLENDSFYFRSISQLSRTLVISSNQAFYRGRGKVSYRDDKGKLVTDPRKFMFLVAATDGQLDKAKEADKLRILVWEIQKDGTRGAVVYDNQIGCSTNLDENMEACQTIGGGNFVIHRYGVKSVSSQSALVVEPTPDKSELVAYPTAFSECTTLAFTSSEDAEYTLELYDLKGAMVKRIAAGSAQSGQRYKHELQADDLGKGMYLVRLTSGSTLHTVKLEVQK